MKINLNISVINSERIFNTENLVVRKLDIKDLTNYYEMMNNISVMQFVKEPLNYNESKLELLKIISYYEEKKHYKIWSVTKKSGKELIGICGYHLNSNKEFEICFRLREAFWGQGFGHEIAQYLVNYLIHHLKLQKLTAYVISKNKKSIKILEKIGFNKAQLALKNQNLEFKYELVKLNIFSAY